MYILASHRIMIDLLSNILSATSELYADSIPESNVYLKNDCYIVDRDDCFPFFGLDTRPILTHLHVLGILGLGAGKVGSHLGSGISSLHICTLGPSCFGNQTAFGTTYYYGNR